MKLSQKQKDKLKKIKRHDFFKELKDLEFEVKFDITARAQDIFGCLGKIEGCFKNNHVFLLCKIKGGDKLVTESTFLQKDGIEYSYFKYRGARMLKVKKHRIIKTKQFAIFKNRERLIIDRDDFSKKLKHLYHRFKRHKYSLIDLDDRLKKLKQEAEYIGKMVKTRIKDFVLDTSDGRIYSIAVTFCKSKGKIQKQFEIEYSGYISGFGVFKKNNKKQIISGLLGLSGCIYNCVPKMVKPTVERKFEFVKNVYAK